MSVFEMKTERVFVENNASVFHHFRALSDGRVLRTYMCESLGVGAILIPSKDNVNKEFLAPVTIRIITNFRNSDKKHFSDWDVLAIAENSYQPPTFQGMPQAPDFGQRYQGYVDAKQQNTSTARALHDLLKLCIYSGVFSDLHNGIDSELANMNIANYDFTMTYRVSMFDINTQTTIEINNRSLWFYFNPHRVQSHQPTDNPYGVNALSGAMATALVKKLAELTKEDDEKLRKIRAEENRLETERLRKERAEAAKEQQNIAIPIYNAKLHHAWFSRDDDLSNPLTTIFHERIMTHYSDKAVNKDVIKLVELIKCDNVNNEIIKKPVVSKGFHTLMANKHDEPFEDKVLYLSRVKPEETVTGFIAALRNHNHFIIQHFVIGTNNEKPMLESVVTRMFKLVQNWNTDNVISPVASPKFRKVCIRKPIGINGLTYDRANMLASSVMLRLGEMSLGIGEHIRFQDDVSDIKEFFTLTEKQITPIPEFEAAL